MQAGGLGSFTVKFPTAGFYRIQASGPDGSVGWVTVDVGVNDNTAPLHARAAPQPPGRPRCALVSRRSRARCFSNQSSSWAGATRRPAAWAPACRRRFQTATTRSVSATASALARWTASAPLSECKPASRPACCSTAAVSSSVRGGGCALPAALTTAGVAEGVLDSPYRDESGPELTWDELTSLDLSWHDCHTRSRRRVAGNRGDHGLPGKPGDRLAYRPTADPHQR